MADIDHWAVDKRIPIVMISGLFIQLFVSVAVGAWWVSGLTHTVEDLSVRENRLEIVVSDSGKQAQLASERLIHVEDKLEQIAQGVIRLEKSTTR